MSAVFTRQQVLRLTGAKPTLLSYWDRTELVVPLKEGNEKHPKVTYTFEQILQIQTIQRLRERLSLQSIRRIISELESHGYRASLFEARILLFDDKPYLLESEDEFNQQLISLAKEDMGQVVMQNVGTIGNFLSELSEKAKELELPQVETEVKRLVTA